MGAYWLHDIGDALAGLPVNYYDGWETRSRSSGGMDAIFGICIHHTASSASSENDMGYMWINSPDEPVGNIYLARDGSIWIGAAGAANCQGSGGPLTCSKGVIPDDSGNKFMISIEAANNGVGEEWPQVQTDNYVQMVRQLCDHYGLVVEQDVYSHYGWVEPSEPGRKIDPAGPSPFGSINASGTWDINMFRGAVLGLPSVPSPPYVPPVEPPPDVWICPPFPGIGDYGCSYDTCYAWQDAMIINGYISNNAANRDGDWGNGMHDACMRMQESWRWDDADGVGGNHTWPHLRSRDVAPCPVCGG